MAKRVVLAYSGGLDTSVAVRWMREEWGVEVVACAVDVGQLKPGEEDADPRAGARRGRGRGRGHRRPRRVRRRLPRARAAGQRAVRGQVPARLGALASGDRRASRRVGAPARRRRGRPRLHRQGQRPGALRGVVAHPGARPRRARAGARVGARPAPTASTSPAKWDIPIEATKEKLYSIDENMWGRAIECGVLENPWSSAPEEPYTLTRSPARRAARAARDRDRRSSRACRSSLDGKAIGLVELIERARRAGRRVRLGSHRHGREPARRHQEPRGLRVPGVARARCSRTRTSKASRSSATSRARSSGSRSASPS